MDKELNKEYWNQRYETDNIPWDVGNITTPIKKYFEEIEDKSLRILIPGCGSAHEAKFLFESGFKNVTLCDWAQLPLDKFHEENPSFPKKNLRCEDFFELDGTYDLIVEQTFFCALNPTLRNNYVKKVHDLLYDKGKLIGLMFNRLFPSGPPFGGNKTEYYTLFSEKFEINNMESCEDSITPRLGSELFIELTKK